MTVASLKRVTLYGLSEDKDAVLRTLQDAACMHIVRLSEPGPLEPSNQAQLRRAYSTYQHLNRAPQQLRPWPKSRAIDISSVIDAALKNKDRLREARDRRDFLAERIAGLRPFGNFVLPPDDVLRGMKLWFYVLPLKQRAALNKLALPWQIVARDHKQLYLVLISREEPPATILPVPRFHAGSQPLSALHEELEKVEIEIEEAEVERAELARSRLALDFQLAQAEDSEDRRAAARMTRDEDRIFALQGWVPAEAAGLVQKLAEAHHLAAIVQDPDAGAPIPTLLENPGPFSGAGALTSFYMTPSYRSWDPSLIVFFSFSIFFAMILADAAYAAILGGIVALFWGRLGRSAAGRRARVMLAFIMTVAFIYGVFAGSYFGIEPSKSSLLGRVAFINVKDFEVMMRVSIIVGVLQIGLANAEVAWRNWGTGIAIARIGWIVAMFGGLAIWLAPSPVAYAAFAIGLATVFFGSASDRPVKHALDWLLRVVDGAHGTIQVTKVFGDVLSYMRLFALGLASASLAATFNSLATQISTRVAGIGVLAAILILLFGHTINIALGILSGVVHGLRLNYIEFFGWALDEEGYPFKPFARRRTIT